MTVLRDVRLLPAAKLLYGRLVLFLGKAGIHQPSHERLALEIGVKPRQVRNLLAQLRECGYMDWCRTQRGTCRYRILERQYSASQECFERQSGAVPTGNGVPFPPALQCLHKEVLKEVFKEGTSSSAPETASEIVEATDDQPPSTATALIPFPQKENWDWPAFQDQVETAIDGGAREQIQESLERQGMDLRHYSEYLKRFPLGPCRSKVAVLIKKASKLSSELKHLDPDESEPPIGKAEHDRRRIAEVLAERERYQCQRCQDTGRAASNCIYWRRSVDRPCPDCELGSKADWEDYQEAASQISRLDPSEWSKRLGRIAELGGDRGRIESLLGCAR
jgi:hypothetical protein